jgi:hypothetical protein
VCSRLKRKEKKYEGDGIENKKTEKIGGSNTVEYGTGEAGARSDEIHKKYGIDTKSSVSDDIHKKYGIDTKSSVSDEIHKKYGIDEESAKIDEIHKKYGLGKWSVKKEQLHYGSRDWGGRSDDLMENGGLMKGAGSVHTNY